MPKLYRASDGNGGEVTAISLSAHITIVLGVVAAALTVIGIMVGMVWERSLILDGLATKADVLKCEAEIDAHEVLPWHDQTGISLARYQERLRECLDNTEQNSERIDRYHVSYRGPSKVGQ